MKEIRYYNTLDEAFKVCMAELILGKTVSLHQEADYEEEDHRIKWVVVTPL